MIHECNRYVHITGSKNVELTLSSSSEKAEWYRINALIVFYQIHSRFMQAPTLL